MLVLAYDLISSRASLQHECVIVTKYYLVLADGLDSFTRFLKTEFSEENIEFWVACEDFKKCKEPQQISLKAKAIYEKFIQNDAPKEVH